MLPFLFSALSGAALGFILARLLLKSLFWPRTPITIGPVRLHGLFHVRREAWSKTLADALTEVLLDGFDLRSALDTVENREALYRGLRREIGARTDAWPSFPFRRQLAVKLEDTVIREVTRYLDRLAHEADVTREAARYLPLANLVQERIKMMDAAALERRVLGDGGRGLRWLTWIGAGGGFVIGLLAPMVGALVGRGL